MNNLCDFLSVGQKLIERGASALAPLSWVWALVVFLKNKAYDAGWIRSISVRCTVVSIGNIVAGGTGKTPFVLMLASRFATRKVAILTRGFGKIADEALLFQRRLPNVSVYVGKSRVELAKKAAQEGAELILLDDGFQHRALHRDFDIVLLRKEDPFGKGHFLPQGFLRDHPKRLRQADLLFVQGRDFCHVPQRIIDEKGGEIASIRDWNVSLFCGIANPSSFKKTILSLGARVVHEWRLGDHAVVDPRRLERFAMESKSLGANVLVTTEKDFVKEPKCSLPIIYIEIEIEWLQREARFEKLIAKINQAIDNKHRL